MLDTNKLIPNRSTKSSLSPVAMTNFIVLKTDLVKIDSILKEKLVLSKVRAGIERQMTQNKKRKEREAELEKKKNKKEEEISINDDPKKTKGGGGLVGFLIGSLIAGVGALVISALPTFIKIGKLIAKVARPIIRVTGALLNMFGLLITNTFKAIKNVQNNFPLDKVQQLPKIVATIGAGIAGLVGAMATFSAANAVIGAISARSLKGVVEATKKQQLLSSGTTGGRLTIPQPTALRKTPTAKSIVPVTTSFEQIGGKSVRLVEQIAQEATTMPFVDIMALKVSGLGFSRGDLLTNVFRLAGYKDDFILEFLSDLFEEQIVDDLSNQEYIETFFKDKGGVFENLKKNINKGIDYNKIIDNLPPTFAPVRYVLDVPHLLDAAYVSCPPSFSLQLPIPFSVSPRLLSSFAVSPRATPRLYVFSFPPLPVSVFASPPYPILLSILLSF